MQYSHAVHKFVKNVKMEIGLFIVASFRCAAH